MKLLSKTQKICIVLLVLWALLVFVITIGSPRLFWLRNPNYQPGRYYNFIPFATISALLQPGGNLQYVVLSIGGNLAMFMPLGFLLPLCWRRLEKLPWVLLAAALTSAAIETVQFFIGRKMDVDDWLLNVLGAMLGWLLWWLFVKPIAMRKSVRENGG